MKRMLVIAAALFGLASAAPAQADIDINIGIGVPGMIYSTPNHPRHGHYHRPAHPHSPRVIVTEPRVIVVPERRWYGDARGYDRPYGRSYDRHNNRRDFHHGSRHKGGKHHNRGRHRD